jgi:hypothetical protein
MPALATDRVALCRRVREVWNSIPGKPYGAVAELWAEDALIALAAQSESTAGLTLRVRRLAWQGDALFVERERDGRKLRIRQSLPNQANGALWLSLVGEAEIESPPRDSRPTLPQEIAVYRWSPPLEDAVERAMLETLIADVKKEIGVVRLQDAEFIIDVGFGVQNRDGYETVIDPLERALRGLGVANLAVGGSRKATEELHLLPLDRQIGQSGVSVNPRVLLAIGVSGAPQHLQYIGPRATVVAFNRDPEAPLMILNHRQPRPRVFPVVGDLFKTVPEFTAVLKQEQGGRSLETTAASIAEEKVPPPLVIEITEKKHP